MNRYRDSCSRTEEFKAVIKLDKYYFKNSDTRLLLNLLTANRGPADALRILALQDKTFQDELTVPDIFFPNLPPKLEKRVYSKNIITTSEDEINPQKQEDRYDLDVTFDHAPAKETLFKHLKDMSLIYTIEITPTSETTSIIPVQINCKATEKEQDELMEEGSKAALSTPMVLKDLIPSNEYTVRVSTVANGRALAFRQETFGPLICSGEACNFSSKAT